jgi:hypothetical protein
LWELTTGKWLYRRRAELETLKAVVETDAPKPSSQRADYPKDLEKIVMKALERTPETRWATAGELRGALDELARSWRFRPTPQVVKKLMATVFSDEVTAWEQARTTGTSLADHLMANPEATERWADTGGTDSEDVVAIETSRAPADSSEPTPAPVSAAPGPRRQPRQTLRVQPRPVTPEPPQPWWMRHQRALIASLIGGVVVGVVLGVVALLSSGSSHGQPTSAPPPVTAPLTSETLEIPVPPTPSGKAPATAPTGAGAKPTPTAPTEPMPLPETKVPIVYPPPLESIRKPTRPASRPAPRPAKEPAAPEASEQPAQPAP